MRARAWRKISVTDAMAQLVGRFDDAEIARVCLDMSAKMPPAAAG